MNKVRYPGKFEGCSDQELGENLYTLSLDGCDDELGDAESFGWYGLIKFDDGTWYIISEDNCGFFNYLNLAPINAQIEWDRLLKEEEEYTAQDYC